MLFSINSLTFSFRLKGGNILNMALYALANRTTEHRNLCHTFCPYCTPACAIAIYFNKDQTFEDLYLFIYMESNKELVERKKTTTLLNAICLNINI